MSGTTCCIPAPTECQRLAGQTLDDKNTDTEAQPVSNSQGKGSQACDDELPIRDKKKKKRQVNVQGESVEESKFREKQVLYWRHRLQKGFLSKDHAPQEDQMPDMAVFIERLEKHGENFDAAILRNTKIHKVLKGLVRISEIPRDEEFHFRERSHKLLNVWLPLLEAETKKHQSLEVEDGQILIERGKDKEWPVVATESEQQKLFTLVKAAYEGDIDKVHRYSKDQECDTALYAACAAGHEGIVDFLLEDAGYTYEDRDSYGSAFLAACRNDYERIVEKLIDANTDQLAQHKYYGPGLWQASKHGHLEVVRLLLDVGDLFNAQAEDYAIAIRNASIAGHHQVVQCIIDKLEFIETTTNVAEGFHSMLDAAREGNTDLVQLLLSIGLDVNAFFAHSGTALAHACEGGHKDIVELLLTRGASVDTWDWESGSAVQAAAAAGHNEVLQTLINHGADVNGSPSQPYGTAIQAAVEGGHEEVVRTLLSAGANPNAVANRCSWPIVQASRNGNVTILNLLLSYGAKLNVRPSPLIEALNEGHEEVAGCLIAAGIDVKNKRNGSALLKAVQNHWDETVLKLIKAGADANAENEEGYTLLSVATEAGDETIVRHLVDGGANVQAHPCGSSNTCLNVKKMKSTSKRSCKHSLLETPTRKGFSGIVRILTDAGADVDVQLKDIGTPIHAACRWNYSEMVQILVDAGADLNVKNKYDDQRDTPLITTIRENHVHLARLLIDAGADVNAMNRYYATALHIATELGSEQMVSMLIRAGAIIDGTSEEWRLNPTPLTIASRKGSQNITRQLIDAGANLDLHDGMLGTPLHIATSCGHEDLVSILIGAGAKVNLPNKGEKFTPLMLASRAGYHRIAQILLSAGADLSYVGDRGVTALICAVQHGHENIVRLLIDAGAQPNQVDYKDRPVLLLAAENGTRDMVQTLIGAGADVNVKIPFEGTALHAAIRADKPDVIKVLLDHGAKPSPGNDDLYSVWIPVCKTKNLAALQMLLEAGMNMDAKDKNDTTVLQRSVESGWDKGVRNLLRAGAEIDAKSGNDSSTALTTAVSLGNEPITRLLLEYGADINLEAELTPLMWASKGGFENVVKICLEAGADVNYQKSSDDHTALIWAVKERHEKVVRMLLDAGADSNLTSGDWFEELTALEWAKKSSKRSPENPSIIQMLEEANLQLSESHNHEVVLRSSEFDRQTCRASGKRDNEILDNSYWIRGKHKILDDVSDEWIRVEVNT